MKKTLTVLSLTLVFLITLDVAVAVTLGWAERAGRLGGLVQYFEYGRSVPGKLARWEKDPDIPGNLYDVAWRSDQVALSAERFLAESEDTGQVIRSYGMSFVNNILGAAVDIEPGLVWDNHAGPGASPNFTFALFEEDRENRRFGDIVVLGILSTSIPKMAALSNRTRAFEQPAPLTFPIYHLKDGDLQRIDPLIESPEAERALAADADARRAWHDQLRAHDRFFAAETFGLVWTDRSPFVRLVRRSLAKSHVAEVDAEIIAGAYPYEEVMAHMIADFARIARQDGQTPVVMLIQTRDPRAPDVLDITRSVLARDNIPYFATIEHVDPGDPSLFLADGHYKSEVDRFLAGRFIEMIDP